VNTVHKGDGDDGDDDDADDDDTYTCWPVADEKY
jgi:hypothetical protein